MPRRRKIYLCDAASNGISRHTGHDGRANQTIRSTIMCLIEAMALAGFNPLGQVLVQFMIVWQRYSLNGSSSASSRSPVASSRESMIQR